MVRKYSKDEVLEFLRANPIMSAAMCEDKRPVSTILLYTVGDDFSICFASKIGTFKDKALKANPLMSISVWKDKEMMVQMSGVALPIEEGPEIDTTLDRLTDSIEVLGDFWPPILKISGGDYVLYKMKPDWLRVLDLSSDSISEVESGFMEYDISESVL